MKSRQKKLDPKLKEAVLLLRYRTLKPARDANSFMKMTAIAKHLNITYVQTRRVCDRSQFVPKKKRKKDHTDRKLEEEHVAFLVDPRTLQQWAGKSLVERCVLFHRKFPNKRVSAMKLCRMYRQHHISRKVVKRYKGVSVNKWEQYLEWQEESWNALKLARKNNQRILFVDELVFTKQTIPRLDYASKGNNITVDESDFYHRYLACVAAISYERGVDAIMIFDSAVTKDSFCLFLEKLQRQNRGVPINIFLDNLQVHKTHQVLSAMERWSMQPIWNVPYRYDFQPIELVFS